jgi:hypothetical protein
MTSLDLGTRSERRIDATDGFWRRQLKPPTTRAQKIFDVLFGVIAPVLCFVFDPIVFKSDFDDGLLPAYQSFTYMVSGLEILLLIVWLICGRELRPHTRLIGGLLVSGALFSSIIGVIILPFSLLGLMLGIGIFGFIPFLTALVYWRNGRDAFQLAGTPFPRGFSLTSVMLGCVLVVGVPAGISFTVSQLVSESMNTVINASPQDADMAIEQIRYLQFLARPQLNKLVSAYMAEQRPAHKEELKRRYAKLTGEDIEVRLRIFAD